MSGSGLTFVALRMKMSRAGKDIRSQAKAYLDSLSLNSLSSVGTADTTWSGGVDDAK